MEIIKPGSNFDFMGKLKIAMVLSAVLVSASIALMFVPGIKWGIDFSGGTEVQVRFTESKDVGDIREVLAQVDLPDDSVQRFGDAANNEFLIKLQSTNFGAGDDFVAAQSILEDAFAGQVSDFKMAADGANMTFKRADGLGTGQIQGALSRLGSVQVTENAVDQHILTLEFGDPSQRIAQILAQKLPEGSFEVMRVESVGPKVGAELRDQGVLSVFFTTILLLIYIAFRFNTEFAPGAILCLLHDVFITLGVLVVTQSEFNLSTVAAVLTVVGYSLNDTIVVFDRIRENQARYRNKPFIDVVNKSINETLSRTLLTSVTTLIVVAALFIFGGSIIHDFALALLIGVFSGTYSSIYIASPVVILTQRLLGDQGQGDADSQGATAAAR